jgi:hypothetical protein
MKLLVATIAVAALTSLAVVRSADARCFWNGLDMECHYPAPPPATVYREVYRDVEPVYEPPRIIRREVIERAVGEPPIIYHDYWR